MVHRLSGMCGARVHRTGASRRCTTGRSAVKGSGGARPRGGPGRASAERRVHLTAVYTSRRISEVRTIVTFIRATFPTAAENLTFIGSWFKERVRYASYNTHDSSVYTVYYVCSVCICINHHVHVA